MSDPLKESDQVVKFQNQWRAPLQSFSAPAPKIVRFVMGHSGGIITDEKHAMCVLLIFSGILFFLAFMMFFSSGTDVQLDKISPPLRELGKTK